MKRKPQHFSSNVFQLSICFDYADTLYRVLFFSNHLLSIFQLKIKCDKLDIDLVSVVDIVLSQICFKRF